LGTLRRDLFNAPNAITATRIAMIPVILAFTYYEGRVNSFVAAMLDGWVARRTGTVTVVGKFLDPLADKLIVMSILIMLVHLGRVPAWLVILILAREFTVTGLRTMAMSEGIVIGAGQEGKYKTSIQIAAISFLLLHYKYRVDFLAFEVDVDANIVGTWLLYLSVAFSLWSAWVYIRDFFGAVYAPDEEGGDEAKEGPVARRQAGRQGP
jgi:CDP-diacylglycerol--glycerol-3-phosphate 3-phosphatidyltransferase